MDEISEAPSRDSQHANDADCSDVPRRSTSTFDTTDDSTISSSTIHDAPRPTLSVKETAIVNVQEQHGIESDRGHNPCTSQYKPTSNNNAANDEGGASPVLLPFENDCTWGLAPEFPDFKGKRFITAIMRARIVRACCLTALPMIMFSCIILSLVFAYRIGKYNCPYPDLCPDVTGNGTSDGYYYVHFKDTSLVFVASWSSTVSLSLVGILTSLYSYIAAQHILKHSDETTDSSLPTPYQTTLLIKALNGEILVLWDFAMYKCQGILWWLQWTRFNRRQDPTKSRMALQRNPAVARVIHNVLAVLLLSVFLSVFVQAADTWLHIDTEMVDLVKIEAESSDSHEFSKGLAPWCLNKPTVPDLCNKHFWGCSIDCQVVDENNWVASIANTTSTYTMFSMEQSDKWALNYTAQDTELDYWILGPQNATTNLDWSADSFGVSTQCSPITASDCDVTPYYSNSTNIEYVNFNCTKERSGIDLAGRMGTDSAQYHFIDFSTLFNDSQPFYGGSDDNSFTAFADVINKSAPSLKDTDQIFKNPWNWATVVSFTDLNSSVATSGDPRVWDVNILDSFETMFKNKFLLLICNTTIWDVSYTSSSGQVRSVDAQRSNDSLVSIAGMPVLPVMSFSNANSDFNDATMDANEGSTVDEMVTDYSSSASRAFLAKVAGQTIDQPASKVQSRNTILVAKVSKAALWTLIFANLSYAVLAIVLTTFAVLANSRSEEVRQLQVRLGITGLTAQLFESSHAERAIESDTDLFKENCGLSDPRVFVQKSAQGGLIFLAKDVDVEKGCPQRVDTGWTETSKKTIG